MSTRSGSKLAVGSVLAITLSLGPLLAAAAPIPEVVYPDFCNGLSNGTNNPAADLSSSVAFFSGTWGAYAPPGSGMTPAVPKAADLGLELVSSAFGEMFAPRPSEKDLDRLVIEAQRLLYPQFPPGTTSRDQVEASATAFRYKYLLYTRSADKIRVDLARFNSWYGVAERNKAVDAIAILRRVLQQDPVSPEGRNTLLDAYYDLAVAEVQSIKMSQGTLAEYRLGFKLPPPGGFVIDEEIALHKAMTQQYEFVLAKYGELLNDRMGVNTASVDATARAGIPLGAYIFQREQPVRSQNASQFVDEDGVLKTVPDYDPDTGTTSDPSELPRPLFAAYKDYVTLLSIFRDYARTSGDLARLYAMRGRRGTQPADNDRDQAYLLINRVQQEIQTTLVLLEGLFPGFEPAPNDASGLAAARNGVQVGLADLSHVRSFLDGEANLLGFDPDFLVLIQEFPDITQGNQFDSYDALVRWIRNTGTSPLNYAETTFERAFANYEKYQGFADQVDKELSAINNTYADRYAEITGYSPDEPGDHLNEPRAGSELWEVNVNIQHANSAVTNLAELTEIGSQHAADAASTVQTANARIASINAQYTSYQNTITEQRDIITTWSSIQAGAQAAYDTLSDIMAIPEITKVVGWTVGIAGALNAATQTVGEAMKGNAQKELDLASAQWEFTTEMADAELVVAQAQDSQNDLARERMTIALQTSDARKIQTQETGRKANLLREVQRIRQAREEGKAGVSGRYYADPVHFLRAQNDMIVADLAFNEAQRWAFFTVRALEFKWNKDFVMHYLDTDWETSTLFKLRNYRELEQMIGAMEQFNTVNLVGFNREPFVDRISLRDDVLARYPGPGTDDGWRVDLETGEQVRAAELLRRKLDRNRDDDGNFKIELNTFVLEKPDGLFFLGPEYRNDGSVFSAGKYLDKIDWIKFKVVTSQAPAVKTANLKYGGTCYIRTRVPPCGDPTNPLALAGEFRVFPFRYFLSLDNGVNWEARPAQEDTVKLVLGANPGEPDPGVSNSTYENRFLRERSVAATGWVLTISKNALNLALLEDIELHVRHLSVSRVVPNCN